MAIVKLNGRKNKRQPRLCTTSRTVIKQAREQATRAAQNPDLAEHAAMIRRLGKRVITDLMEIGRRLKEAKGLVGHGNWGPWLKAEFGWSEDTALNFMRAHELSEDYKSRKFRDLMIAPSALYLLAKKSTPEAVRTAVIERAEAGETITVNTVQTALATAETEPADTASPTNNWGEDLRRGFREALKVANDAIRIGHQAHAVMSPELREQMRETLEPLSGRLSELREGGQALLDYFGLIENVLSDGAPLVLAEAAE